MRITNATLINEGQRFSADVLIKNQRIEKIAPHIDGDDDNVLDAKGMLLLPGMIDDQVHFREPGLTHKGDLFTESRAAVAGGITSFMEMPNTNPTATTRERLAEKYGLAAGRSHANYAFYFGAANDNLEELKRLQPGEACAVKIFMGASTGNMLVDDPKVLEAIFAHCPYLLATHCEFTPTITINEAAARAQYGENVPFSQHPLIRSREACHQSTVMAVDLARKHGSNLHVLHLTSAEELALLGNGVTGEACVHHLYFNDSHYDTLGAKLKCNPAVKQESDRLALLEAVRDGRLCIIATDHAPHTIEEKARSYFQAPSGLPLVQHALLMLLDLVQRQELRLETVVERACHTPATRFGVQERGFLREGYFADLVLIEDAPVTITPESVLYKCGWSPVEGQTFQQRIHSTFVNGQLAYQHDKGVLGVFGQRLGLV
jgi:dihydroorotase